MKKFAIGFLYCFGIGCTPSSEIAANNSQVLNYSKDYRTGLCFASMYLGSTSGTLSNVPCTPEVEKLIPPGVRKEK